jgi:hypothetical protein
MSTILEHPASDRAPAAAHHDRARIDTLVLLFDQSFPALFQSFIIGTVLCWTLWGHVESKKLLFWLGASSVLRLGMYVQYFRVKPTGPAVLAWERPYAATLMLSSLIWGLGMLWLMPPDDVAGQFVILFFVAGLMGGAIVAYSAHRGMTIAAMAAVLLPSTVWLYFQPSQIALGMAVSATIFMAGALRGTQVLYAAMQTRLHLSYELRHANEVADRMARTDELTGINNRRSFMELGEQTSRLCHRQGKPLSALVMDVDHFKKINDTHGHSAGDAVLAHVGALLCAGALAARSSPCCWPTPTQPPPTHWPRSCARPWPRCPSPGRGGCCR